MGRLSLVFGVGLLLLPSSVLAQSMTIDLGGGAGGSTTAALLQLVALITILSLAPSILVTVTSFTRMVVVLSLLRSALGIQQTPPNVVLISLALFLTAFVMTPVFSTAFEDGVTPYLEEQIDEAAAFDATMAPFRTFMLDHVREEDLALFLEMGGADPVAEADDVPLKSLIPAFMITELRRAFEIGFLLFLPFLIIDMVVASILMSMGMMMLPPIIVSLPFKLIFFVLVDGWYLLAGSLVKSYGV
ncbi:MAG: flagellar type III secretion system pore protein FliP [Pseudomonadota bacterium]